MSAPPPAVRRPPYLILGLALLGLGLFPALSVGLLRWKPGPDRAAPAREAPR